MRRPYERPVNMMFQSYALFPHMTVAQNVAYGLRRNGVPPAADQGARRRDARAGQARAARASASQTSSRAAQQQRVALARALVKRPKLLLLDEPLAALDKKLREHTQFELANLQYQLGTTFVVVTHDQDEAMTLASRIAVMSRRPDRAGGHSRRGLRVPGQSLRRELRRQHQPDRGPRGECERRARIAALRCAQRGSALCSAARTLGVRRCGQRGRASREDHDQPQRPGWRATATSSKGVVRDLGYFGDQSLYRV